MLVDQNDRSRFTVPPLSGVYGLRLLFIHGWATDSRVWRHQIEAFSKDYEIITVTLPGHGDGDHWFEPTLKPAVKKILLLTTQHSSLNTYIGIGWSLGAMVLMEMARFYPALFQRLVLVGVTPKFVMDETFPWGQPRGRVRQMIRGLKRGFSETLERFYHLNFTEEELTSPEVREFIELYQNPPFIPLFQRGKEGEGGSSIESIVTALEALSEVDLRKTLSEVTVPTLLIHGEKDQVSSMEAGRYLARNLPMARMEVFKDTGHAPFLTRREEFNMVVRRFLK